jgi:hypothetical protein
MTPRTSGEMTIGGAAWTPTNPVRADLDEVRITPRPWSDAEVMADFETFSVPQATDGFEPEGLVAHWAFDETAAGAGVSFADSSGGAHALTVSGPRHAAHSGLLGNARRFAGYPDSTVAAGAEDFARNRFTFSSWVRLDQYPTVWGALFGNYDGDSAGWYVGVYQDGRVILSACGPGSKPWLLSSVALPLGRWSHVAVTFDGSTRNGRIYVDGNAVASATFPAWSYASGAPPTLGKAPWASTGWLTFSIDEARFYGGALSAGQILNEYAALAGSVNPAPVADWRFDEAAPAEVLADSTGRGHGASVEDLGAVDQPGLSGNAWRFSGAGGAAVPAHPDLASPSFTFDAWIKLDVLPSRWGVLYSTFAADSRGWYVAVSPTGNVILCIASQPNAAPWLVSAGAIQPGAWTHVAVTYDAVNRKGSIYLDGALDRTAVFPGYTPQPDYEASFARASWTGSYFLPVTVDRVRLWTRERTAQEILAAMAQF